MSDILLVPKQEPSYLMVPVEGVQADLVTKTGTIIYVPLASTTSPGIVQVGDGLLISGSGLLSLDQTEIPIKSISKNGTLIVPDAQKNVNIDLSKSDVGLGNVDNTSDLNKPISSSQQAALNTKLDKYQGTENYEKGLVVGSDGYIMLSDDVGGRVKTYYNNELYLDKTEKFNYSTNFDLTKSGRQVNVDIAASVLATIANKVDKVSGKGLSTEDYTTEEKTKLASLENYDDTALSERISEVESDVSDINGVLETYGDIVTHDVDEFATATQGGKADTALQPNDNVSVLVNDAGYLTQHQDISGKLDKKPDGTHDLLTNNKVNVLYLPDQILGQLLYGGTVNGSTGIATLTPNAKARLGTTSNTITLTNDTTAITGYGANDGVYYIVSDDGNFASLGLLVGDWLLSVGTAWKKIDNTDAVTGIKGDKENSYRIGNVNLTPANIGAEPEFSKNTAFNKDFETTATNIKMNGSQSVGSLNTVARADHVHPSDTSKQDKIDSTHKLSADLLEDGSTNKVYTSTEKTKLANIDLSKYYLKTETYSKTEADNLLASKQDSTDNRFDTTNKTVVGAVNELKSSSDLYYTQIQGLLTTTVNQGIKIDGKVDVAVVDPNNSKHISTVTNLVGELAEGVVISGTNVDFNSATFARYNHNKYELKSVYEAEDSSYKYESSLKLEHGDYTEDSGAPTLTYEIKSNDNLKFQGLITEELSMLYYPMGTQEYPNDFTAFQIAPNTIALGTSYENNLGSLTIAPGAVIVETNGTFTYNEHEVATTNQIPTVNNATITITQDGTPVGSFTLNQSSDQTISLTAGSVATDVRVDGNSVLSNDIAYLVTEGGNYNSSTNKLITKGDLSGYVKTHTVLTGEDDIYLDIGADADSGGILLVAGDDEISGSPTKQAVHMVTPDIVISQVMGEGALGVSQVMSTSGMDMYSTNTVENDDETENILYVTKTAESINLSLNHSVTDTLNDTITSSQAVIDFTIDQLELDLPLVVPATTNTTDLGSSSYKFKDLYLAGQLKDGTNSISIADIATLSDIPDISGKQNSTDNNLQTTAKTVVGAINEVDSIAKQANIAKSYASYSAFITALNSASATDYKVGQSFYIETLEVPDLWIISVESSSSTYTYTTDSAFISATGAVGGQQVGYYKIGQLETQKVDLTNYVQKTTTIAGVDLQDNITVAEMQNALSDTTHRFVTDVEKSTWGGKQDAITSTNKLDYSLLSNTPTIPTVNDATLTLQLNGSQIDTFTANASSNKTIDVKALPNYSLSIGSTNGGNPRQVKFMSVNYTNFDSNNGAYFKLGAMECHGNGQSYAFLEDIIIGVSYNGTVSCNIYKYVQAETTLDSVTRNYGDVFYTIDTTNKVVDFYILMGQYTSAQFTPATKIGSTKAITTANGITQLSGSPTYYSSGTKTWATGNSTLYARLSDIPDLSNYYTKSGGALNENAVISLTGSNPYVAIKEGTNTQYYLQGYQGEIGISVGGAWTTKRISLDSNGKVFIPSKSIGDGTYTYTLPSNTGTIALTSDIPSTSNFVDTTSNQNIKGSKSFDAPTTAVLTNRVVLGENDSNITRDSFNITSPILFKDGTTVIGGIYADNLSNAPVLVGYNNGTYVRPKIRQNSSTLKDILIDGDNISRLTNDSGYKKSISTGSVSTTKSSNGTSTSTTVTIPSGAVVTGINVNHSSGTQYGNGAAWGLSSYSVSGTTVTVNLARGNNDGTPTSRIVVFYATLS